MSTTHPQITQKDAAKFRALAQALSDFNNELRTRVPAANIYLADDSLTLLCGPSHGERDLPNLGNIIASVRISGSGGGDW